MVVVLLLVVEMVENEIGCCWWWWGWIPSSIHSCCSGWWWIIISSPSRLSPQSPPPPLPPQNPHSLITTSIIYTSNHNLGINSPSHPSINQSKSTYLLLLYHIWTFELMSSSRHIMTLITLILVSFALLSTVMAGQCYCAQLRNLADCAECHKSCRWEIADKHHGRLSVPSSQKTYQYTNGTCREAYLP